MDERRTDRRRQHAADFGFYYSPQAATMPPLAASKPDHTGNVRVTRPPEDWIYSPTKYWPQEGQLRLCLYDTDAAVSVSCGTGAPRVTYAVPDAVAITATCC